MKTAYEAGDDVLVRTGSGERQEVTLAENLGEGWWMAVDVYGSETKVHQTNFIER